MNDPSLALAPEVPLHPGTQARSHAFRVGDIHCTALSDGGVFVPAPPHAPAGGSGLVLSPLACLLLALPGRSDLVLLDAGFGPNAKRAGQPLPTAGRLLASLAAAGIGVEEIGTVLISHIHPDHVDGLYRDDGRPNFPNAEYRVGAEELAFWRQDPVDLSWSSAPDPIKAEMVTAARRLLGFGATTLATFRAGEPALPGIETMLLPGHTPGQVGFVLSSGGERLVYTADAFTRPELSIEAPERQNPFDLDPAQGVTTRKMLLQLVSQPGSRSFSPHFPWPNVVKVQSAERQYVWEPAA